MARTTEQKIKLLVLYDILCKQTDEEHHLTTNRIIELLTEKGIDISRKVLPDDIDLLNKYGYEVLVEKAVQNEYYVVNHQLECAEVVMLSDVVKASKLTVGHKERLIEKLEETIGECQTESIIENLTFCDMPERSNNSILYYIDTISKAILSNKKISYKYYSLDENKQKKYRKDGKRYIVNPLFMIWNKDNYYLVTYHDRYEGLTNYRIDHMDDVQIEDTDRAYREEYAHFKPEEYRKQAFSMFGGEATDVEITFPAEMIDDIYDKFGEKIEVVRTDKDTFKCTATVQVSKTFFGWVVGSCGKVHITSPEAVITKFNEFVDHIKENY